MIIPHPYLITSSEINEIVYLAASIRTFYKPEYEHAIEIIQNRHPGCDLLLSRSMYSDSQDFGLTYRYKLRPVDTLYVLPDRKLRVGAGVYTEWEYLKFLAPNCKEALAFNPNEDLRLSSDFRLELLDRSIRTLKEFARVIYSSEG